MSTILLIEILAGTAAVLLVAAMWTRPGGLLAVLFALTIVGAAIVVSWGDVEQYRSQRADIAAFNQRSTTAAVTVPPPDHPHAGT